MILEVVKSEVVAALTEIQSGSGRRMSSIRGSTRPLRDLEGFDSLNAVEAASGLSARLGCHIAPNVMLSTRGGEPLTVDEIVDKVYHIIENQTGEIHEQLTFQTKQYR